MADQERCDRYRAVLQFARQQISKLLTRQVNWLPEHTVEGQWGSESQETNGYLAGILWQFARLTDDPGWLEAAERCAKVVECAATEMPPSDLGRALLVSHLPWYQQTSDKSVRESLFDTGMALAQRFHHRGRFYGCDEDVATLSIEILTAVPLLQIVADATLDQDLARHVIAHGRTTRDHLLREDGSVCERMVYNSEQGQFAAPTSRFGKTGKSSWSRGISWSLYGFTKLYELTRATEFLRAAERNAEYWVTHVPSGRVPSWDFAASNEQIDSAAAAITASGLLDLARLVTEPAHAITYRSMALATLDILVTRPFLVPDDTHWEGVLRHGTYNVNTGHGVDESLATGDYYLVEALTKVVLRDTE